PNVSGSGRGGPRRQTNERGSSGDNRAGDCKDFPPTRRRHADVGKGQRCVVAGNGGWSREKDGDHYA
ncbi:MAG: hypothetical protein WB766_23740, partial [Roseiarcus sp.]